MIEVLEISPMQAAFVIPERTINAVFLVIERFGVSFAKFTHFCSMIDDGEPL